MPKNPNIRKRKESTIRNNSVDSDDRKRWLEQLKSWAVRQLSSSAPPQARVCLRQSVEKGMKGYGPQSPAAEIQDILLAIVSEAKRQLEKIETCQGESGTSVERKRWIVQWKEWAVAQLPSTASPQTRATLRQSVEQALVGHDPRDSEAEIRDLILALVAQIKFQMEIEELEKQRASKKNEMMDLADKLLAIAIQRFPSQIVGEPNSWERHHLLETLGLELRSHLQDRLTGKESVEDLGPIIKAFVGGWEKSSNPNPQNNSGVTRRILLTVAAGAAVATATAKFPKIKEKVREGYDFLQTQGSWDEVLASFADAYRKSKSDSSESKTSG
jgi:hypothetical protein